MRTTPLALFLALGCLATASAQERSPLERWLAEHEKLERWDEAVVQLRRRAPLLDDGLLAIAGGEARPLELRRRALALEAAIADGPKSVQALGALEKDPLLGESATRAVARVTLRRDLLSKLGALAPLLDLRPIAAADVSAVASPEAALEVVSLARDPLLETGTRRVAVASLPFVARAAGADATELAIAVATGGGDGLARASALAIAADRAPAPVLARALGVLARDPDPGLARTVLASMPLLKSEESIRTFVAAAVPETATAEERARALEALGRTGSPLVLEQVEKMLREAAPVTDDEVRAAGWSALARLGARSASEAAIELSELLSSPRLEARRRAIDDLGGLPRETVEDVLTGILEKYPDEARLHAAEAARVLGLRLAGPLAKLALSDASSLPARTAAVRALAVSGDPQRALATLLEPDPQAPPELASLRRAAAEALASKAIAAATAIPALQRALSDPSSVVRIAAARSLGAWRDPRATQALVDALNGADLASRERCEVVRALGSHAWNEEIVNALEHSLAEDFSPELAIAAVDALTEAPHELAMHPLLDLLDHPDYAARRRAHRLLLAVSDASPDHARDPFDYDPSDERANREEPARRWREWWAEHQKKK